MKKSVSSLEMTPERMSTQLPQELYLRWWRRRRGPRERQVWASFIIILPSSPPGPLAAASASSMRQAPRSSRGSEVLALLALDNMK